jgi:DNA-binding beta-propeller fold protein YncE
MPGWRAVLRAMHHARFEAARARGACSRLNMATASADRRWAREIFQPPMSCEARSAQCVKRRCLPEGVGITAGVPQTADNLVHVRVVRVKFLQKKSAKLALFASEKPDMKSLAGLPWTWSGVRLSPSHVRTASAASPADGIHVFRKKDATRTLARLCCLVAVVAAGLGIRPAMAQLQSGEQQISMPGSPFAVRTTPNGRWALVSVSQSVTLGAVVGSNGVVVLERFAGTYRYISFVPLEAPPSGLALNRDGTLLLAAANRGVAFIDVERAVTGAPDAIIGFEPLGRMVGPITVPRGTIEVALSADERFIFAANETFGTVSVIDRNAAIRSGFARSAVVGDIPVDVAPVGLAVSKDGAHLYVTNERASPGTPGYDPSACRIQTGPGTTTLAPEGTILVVDTGIAEVAPSSSVVSRVLAGCAPVRIQLMEGKKGEDHHIETRRRDGDEVAWVTARGENQLKAFSTARLLSDPAHAMLASTPVGTAPVGLQPFADGKLIAVANSNRFGGGMPGSVSIVATGQVLANEPATLRTFGVGVFPRDWALSPDGRKLLLTEFGSSVLDIFDEDHLRTANSRGDVRDASQ